MLAEFFPDFQEKFFCVKAIDLGRGRFGEVEDNNVIFFLAFAEECSSILIEYVDFSVFQ